MYIGFSLFSITASIKVLQDLHNYFNDFFVEDFFKTSSFKTVSLSYFFKEISLM